MSRVFPSVFSCLALASFCVVASSALSKIEEWQEIQGAHFRGEPTDVLGPVVLFRTSNYTGRRVALQKLAPEDCVRLREQLQNRPPRAERWSEATGEMTRELVGRVVRVDKDRLVPVDLAARPEPEIVLAFYVDYGDHDSWDALEAAVAPFRKLQRDFPGIVDGVMYGLRHSKTQHLAMATSKNVPWLVTDLYEQPALTSLNHFLPEICSIMVLSRNGVPLFSAEKPDEASVTKLFADLTVFLDLVRPENPKSWPARGYYLSVVQPIIHAHGHADPLLVGNPLMTQGLTQRNVFHFDAEIQVAADGQVAEVKVLPDDLLPDKMIAPIGAALKKAVFVPAVQDGKFVDGVYLYHFKATL